MKFLIISQFAGSKKHGMVLRNYNWAIELQKLGHEVTIVASSYSHYRQKETKSKGRVTEEYINGVRYLWLWGPKYSGKNLIGRLFSMFIFILQLLVPSKLLPRDYDVIVSSSPHPFTIYPAYYLSKIMKAKLIFDIRDLWPLSVKEIGGYKSSNPLIWFMQKTENFSYKKSDLVTVVPRNSADYFKTLGFDGKKVWPLGNGLVIDDQVEAEELSPELIKQLDLIKANSKYVIGYAGTIGNANAMNCFIKAIKKTDKSIQVVIIGKGSEKTNLIALVETLELKDRVHFFDPIKPTQVHSFLSFVDLTYTGTHYKDFYKYGASLTKVNDYLMAEKPVIYSVGDPGNSIELSGAGISCEAENIEEITGAINQLTSLSSNELKLMGEAGRKWLMENQLVSKQMKDLVNKLHLKG